MASIIPGITTAQQGADIVNNKAEKGGDSSQDWVAKSIMATSTITGIKGLRSGVVEIKSTEIRDDKIFNWTYGVGFNPLGLNNEKTILAKPNGNFQAISFTPFTGCHVITNEKQDFKIGELICIEAKESKDIRQPNWHGRYAKKGENGIFGIVFDSHEEPKSIPEVGVNKFYSIACLGDMKVLCNGENGNIEYGDELCASSKSGEAMKFTGLWEDRKQICGKAGRSYTFINDEVVLIDTAKE